MHQNGKAFTFPFYFVCPKNAQPAPAVVLINFTPAAPDPYLPSEELCDLGLAVASFGYTDVSPDNDDFVSGPAACSASTAATRTRRARSRSGPGRRAS